jgi:hypothetical protein
MNQIELTTITARCSVTHTHTHTHTRTRAHIRVRERTEGLTATKPNQFEGTHAGHERSQRAALRLEEETHRAEESNDVVDVREEVEREHTTEHTVRDHVRFRANRDDRNAWQRSAMQNAMKQRAHSTR